MGSSKGTQPSATNPGFRAFRAARHRYEEDVSARRVRATEEFARAVDQLADAVGQLTSLDLPLQDIAKLSDLDSITLKRLIALSEA